jgi:hypothetical protein
MHWIRGVAREVVGLFVDDGSFAGAIVAWLLFCIMALPHIAAAAHWAGLVLFAGLTLILIESVLRFARKRL